MALALVSTFSSIAEAQIACAALRAHGLEAEVFDENFGQLMPTGVVGDIRLFAPEEDCPRARRLLAELSAEAD